MKISFAPSVLLFLLGSGCTVSLEGDVRPLGSYASVTNRSDADVKLVNAGNGLEPGDVMVVCDGDIVANVDTSVDGEGNLVIQFAADIATVLGCEVHVVTDGVTEIIDDGDGDIICEEPMTDVRRIEVKGNGSIDLASVEADELDILIVGTGALTIDHVAVETLRIDLRGAGDATLGGDAVFTELLISGNGDLRAQDLTVSDTLDALLDGTGNGVITVTGTVNAEVHGEATLEIHGDATEGVITEVDGGTVTFL